MHDRDPPQSPRIWDCVTQAAFEEDLTSKQTRIIDTLSLHHTFSKKYWSNERLGNDTTKTGA